MAKSYRQLGLDERKRIQEGLDRGDGFREMGRLIGRSASTVSREVRANRSLRAFRPRKAKCRDGNWCKRVGVCAECAREGAFCAGCDARDCRDECPAYAEQAACDVLVRAPWVCNGCRKNRYGCNRGNRFVYGAAAAQAASDARRSESRRGIGMPRDEAERALARTRDGESRGLSPYEISVLYKDEAGVSQSTVCRWTEAGYGGLANLGLERKVGFGPRSKKAGRRGTSHSRKRSFEEFGRLPGEARAARAEMDCVIGRSRDRQAVLTLCNVPCHVQLALLLAAHDCASVRKEPGDVRGAMPPAMFERRARVFLTDNGEELSDEDGLGAILGEDASGGELRVRLYHCDPRQSQQKGGCEKNHTEIRQILEKGLFPFDELTRSDMAVLMSHANSNPRASLGGKSPIQMLRFVYGEEDADAMLAAFGVREVGRDELVLRPEILDIERERRGEPPLTRLK